MSIEKDKQRHEEQRKANREERDHGSEDEADNDNGLARNFVCEKDPVLIADADGNHTKYYVANKAGTVYYVMREDGATRRVELENAGASTGEISEFAQAALLTRPDHLTAERQAFSVIQAYAAEVRDMHRDAREILHSLDPSQFRGGDGEVPDSVAGSGEASGGSDNDSDTDEQDTEVAGEYPEAEDHVGEIEMWIANAAELMGNLDADAMEYEAAGVDGRNGVKFEANPFKAGYWSDGDWVDKAGFDEHKEALKTLTQNNDEVEYHGKPDYFNFVPADDVESLTATE